MILFVQKKVGEFPSAGFGVIAPKALSALVARGVCVCVLLTQMVASFSLSSLCISHLHQLSRLQRAEGKNARRRVRGLFCASAIIKGVLLAVQN